MITIGERQEDNTKQPQLIISRTGDVIARSPYYYLILSNKATGAAIVVTPYGEIAWVPTELCYKDKNGQLDYIVGSSPSLISCNGNEARYSRTFPITEDVFRVERECIKHNIVLQRPPRAPAEYLSGKIMFGVTGTVKGVVLPTGIHNEIETGPFLLPRPVATDARGMSFYGNYEVVALDSGFQLFVWFDYDLIAKSSYPIVIDPTIAIMSSDGRPWYASDWLANVYNRPIQIDNNGNIYIAVNDALFVSNDQGSTWNSLPLPATDTNEFHQPSIAIDNNGRIHAAWFSFASMNIYYARYENGEWTSPIVLATTETSDFLVQPCICIASNGTIHVVYQSSGKIWHRSCINNTWTNAIAVPSLYSNRSPAMTIDSKNNLHVVWWGSNQGSIVTNLYYSMFNGSSWSNYYALTNYSHNQSQLPKTPSIATDFSDNIHVVWCIPPNSTARFTVFYRKKTGSSWGSITTVSTNSADMYDAPTIGILGNNTFYVVYENRYNASLVFRYFNGSAWSSESQFTIAEDSGVYVRTPLLVEREKFNVLPFVWQKINSNTNQVYLEYDNIRISSVPSTITIVPEFQPITTTNIRKITPNTLSIPTTFQAVGKLVRAPRTVTPNTLEISVSSPGSHRFYVPRKFEAEIVPQGGTLQDSGYNSYMPYNTTWHDNRIQFIILASELLAAGFKPGDPLTAMKFRVGSILPGMDLVNFRIRLQNTNQTTSTQWVTTNWTLVYGPTTIPRSSFTTTGQWYEHVFHTQFVWDGRNLLVDVTKDAGGYMPGGSNYIYSNLSNRACGMYSHSAYTWPYDSAYPNALDYILQTRIVVERNPSPPTNLSCSDGSGQPRLTWTINETGATQIKFQVQIERYDTETSSWELHHDSGEVASSDQYYDVPASAKLESNTQYRFRVMVWLSTGLTTPWSDYFEWTPNYVEPAVTSIDMTLEAATLIFGAVEPSTLEAVLEVYSPELQVGPVSLSPDTLEVTTEFVTPSRVQCDYTAQLDELVLDTSIHGVDDLIKGPVSVEPLPLQSTITANKVLRAMHRIVRLKIYKDSKLLNEVDSHAGT